MNFERMEQQLELHEGFLPKPYLDTLGIWTIAFGYNLEARGHEQLGHYIGRKLRPVPTDKLYVDVRHPEGVEQPFFGIEITRAEGRKVLRADIERLHQAIPMHFPFYLKLSEIRQRVVLDMVYNMGWRTQSFVNTRRYIEQENWSKAAINLWQSKWAHQVDDGPGGKFGRADRLIKMLTTNQDYTK